MIATTDTFTRIEPYCSLMTITPTMALNWLEHANTNNRKIIEAYVKKLARDMKAGRWRLTHEGIAFDPHGVLLDGQHRFARSSKPIFPCKYMCSSTSPRKPCPPSMAARCALWLTNSDSASSMARSRPSTPPR